MLTSLLNKLKYKARFKNVYMPVNMGDNKLTEIAKYIIENSITIREASQKTHYKKSTLHRYLHDKLERMDPELYERLCDTFKENKKEGVSKGGRVTQAKLKVKKQKQKQKAMKEKLDDFNF